jgi:hypothetical protein
MTTLDNDMIWQQRKQTLPLFLALIAAGLAGNYFKFTIFLNVDFIFGSICALLALQFCGLGRGILAGTVIAGYTWFLWNHPYALIVMTVEVAVVGWLMARHKMGLVLADTLYDNYTGKLTLLFAILLAALALAELLSRKIVVTLGRLRTLTHELPVRLATDGHEIVWPESGIKEDNHLINNFREMAASLTELFIETRQADKAVQSPATETGSI